MRARLLMIGVAMVVTPALLVGCGSSSKSSSSTNTTTGGLTVPTTAAGSGTTVNVVVSDTKGLDGAMTMVVTPPTAPAGKVTFVVKNTGTIKHEFVVLDVDTAFDALPVADDEVSEDANIGEIGDIAAGQTESLTLDLGAGKYALVCNIAKHYGLGMRAGFTVS
jgi:uncharacterized cupredoxin-like copper-binding protein